MATDFLLYLLQASIVFTVLYFLFRISVSRLTFHKLNRVALLLFPIISILLPVIDASTLLPDSTMELFHAQTELLPFTENYPDLNEMGLAEGINAQSDKVTIGFTKYILIIYLLGVILMLFQLVMSVRKVMKIKRGAMKIKFKGIDVYLNDSIAPFSYFNWIFIPEHEKTDRLVLEHERVHIQKRHSLDLLYINLYSAIFWFNPIIHMYRKSLKAVHEYEADAGVLAADSLISDYLQLILDSLSTNKEQRSLSYFNNPSIKQRLKMMTKHKSGKSAVIAYTVLAAGLAIMVMAFTTANNNLKPTRYSASPVVGIQAEPPSIFPLKVYNPDDITSEFGKEIRQPKTKKISVHQGLDIRAETGTAIVATADGTVLKAKEEGNWGNLVVIIHSDGYQSWYAHLDRFEVSENKSVKKGDVIGYVGNTGLSSGPHLHYEVRRNDKHLNPKDFFTN